MNDRQSWEERIKPHLLHIDRRRIPFDAYRDGKRGNSLMHNMSVPYADSIIESIASYYASQPAK